MKKLFLSLFCFLSYSTLSFGCCVGPLNTLIEVLNQDRVDIFSCRILNTYIYDMSYESVAIIQDRYVGSPMDTVLIRTDGFSSAGGRKLIPGEEWLIFSQSSDHYQYSATVCDGLSTKLSEKPNLHLDIVLQYQLIKTNKFTGHKIFYGKEKNILSEGDFFQGKPHGLWKNYTIRGKLQSEVHYNKGKLDGLKTLYMNYGDEKILDSKSYYKLDTLLWTERRTSKTEYQYLKNGWRKEYHIAEDEKGNIIQIYHALRKKDFQVNKINIFFKEGAYLNKDTTSYSPLAKGQYHLGARVGKWVFYNKKGDIIDKKNYPYPDESIAEFVYFDDLGNPSVIGQYANGKRTGIWKGYYKNKLTYEQFYSDGELTLLKIHSRYSYLTTIPYKNGVKNGQEIVYSDSLTIKSITSYKNGKKDGPYFSTYKSHHNFTFHEYKNGRKNGGNYLNGYLHGDVEIYHDGVLYEKGTYWFGYKRGKWVSYDKKNNTYKFSFYRYDINELQQSNGNRPICHEMYSNDGVLIKEWGAAY